MVDGAPLGTGFEGGNRGGSGTDRALGTSGAVAR